MRKNIVVSMLIIALAAALLGGATFAWFVDREDAQTSFTSGTLTLGEISDFTGSVSLAPGDMEEWNITIENSGNLDMYYRMYFTSTVTDSEGATLTDVMEVALNDTIGSSVKASTLLSSVTGTTPWIDPSWELAGSGTADYTIEFLLPDATGNDYQGAEWDITLHVEATQVDNNETDTEWTN